MTGCVMCDRRRFSSHSFPQTDMCGVYISTLDTCSQLPLSHTHVPTEHRNPIFPSLVGVKLVIECQTCIYQLMAFRLLQFVLSGLLLRFASDFSRLSIWSAGPQSRHGGKQKQGGRCFSTSWLLVVIAMGNQLNLSCIMMEGGVTLTWQQRPLLNTNAFFFCLS